MRVYHRKPLDRIAPHEVQQWYLGSMRVKTSVTLPSSLLEEIDRLNNNRSAFLENATRFYLAQSARHDRDAKDAAILEKNAERLNREATDVLEYQDLPE
jgi:metal-responsive CopG/Arc/MetJ family transcriptional regulator